MELAKSIVLVGLCVSTMVLLAMTDLFQLNVPTDWKWNIENWGNDDTLSVQTYEDGWGQGGVMYPARIGLIGEEGCTIVQYDHLAVEDLFSQLINLLTDALSGAQEPALVSEGVWQRALSGGQIGVYFDFLGTVPLDNLYLWSSSATNVEGFLSATVRHLVLSVVDDQVVLYYINEDDGLYYACDSSANIQSRLEYMTYDTEVNGQFGFQIGVQSEYVSQYSVIGNAGPKPVVYDVVNPLVILSDGERENDDLSLEELYERVSFQLHSATEYPVSDGRTIREGGDSLTVTNNGYVEFRAGETSNPRILVTSQGGSATIQEQLDGAWAFVNGVLAPYCGDARLYLMEWEVNGNNTEVYVGYQLDGAHVHVGDLGYAAKIVVTESKITEFEFQLRQYTSTGGTSLVLDEYRAMVAMDALGERGKELVLAYIDLGGDTVSASWIGK